MSSSAQQARAAMSSRLRHRSNGRYTAAYLVSALALALFCALTLTEAALRGRSTGARRISGRGLGPRPGDRVGVGRRKLLLEGASVDPNNGHCVSAYETLRRRPDLSALLAVVDTLPKIQAKMKDPNVTFTLFAPTNAAIDELKNWEGWIETRNHLVQAFGSGRLARAYLLAYHATRELYTADALKALSGDDVYLEDLLNNVMPLEVNVTADGEIHIVGLGSSATVIEGDIRACSAIIHIIDTVLLPFDGDGVLDSEQEELILKASASLRRRYGLPAFEAVDTNDDGKIDVYERVGAVDIETVPTEWTKDAIDAEAV